ncbi:polycomb complex protein bmi-1 [Plakobranchus ocellatus]|uniref:Polycomb complex protein bmi-1 n=1 Tax=Plakobranchus ocellatus TaxID=259542 RepID=A0AAV4BZD7_9GAST|nr:polycomb complex protein bmi-1 [Plakobranchus ocellatus]
MSCYSPSKRLRISELNPHLLCALCGGYLIDATTIIECLHSFCKTCILRYLESSNYCPICEVLIHKTRPWQNIRLDHALQNAVYKTVPGLFQNEMKRRREFYQKQSKEPRRRPSSTAQNSRPPVTACSGGEFGDRVIFSKDEKFSISIEFSPDGKPVKEVTKNTKRQKNTFPHDKRYLHCPAGLRIEHLKKFIRAKFSLPLDIQIDLFYERDPLCDTYSLMDVAYICMWKRDCVLRLFYSFYEVPKKIRRLDTTVVKLETEKVTKEGAKAVKEGEEKSGHLKTDEETHQKKKTLTERKFRSQKEEKHKKQQENVQNVNVTGKLEEKSDIQAVEAKEITSKENVTSATPLPLWHLKDSKETNGKAVTDASMSEKQHVETKSLSVDLKSHPISQSPTFACNSKDVAKKSNISIEQKNGISHSLGEKEESKVPLSSSTKSISAFTGMKRKYPDADGCSCSDLKSTTPQMGAVKQEELVQTSKESSHLNNQYNQTESKLDLKCSADDKVPSSLSDVKCGSTCGAKNIKLSSHTQTVNQGTQVVAIVQKSNAATTSQGIKSVSRPEITKPTTTAHNMMSVHTHHPCKSSTPQKNLQSTSTSQNMKLATVYLDKNSIIMSQVAKISSSSPDTTVTASQNVKPSNVPKDTKLPTIPKETKSGVTSKATQASSNFKDQKSNSNSKDTKQTVKYAHQSQQTVSYTIVSCGINEDNGKFSSGSSNEKAPLKMLIKSSESRDSKTCFIASGPAGVSKESKHKVIYPNPKIHLKDNKVSSKASKTSVYTHTEKTSSRQKQPKEKKSRYNDSKSSVKSKKNIHKAATNRGVSQKSESNSGLMNGTKSSKCDSVFQDSQDIYNFSQEEKEELHNKPSIALKINFVTRDNITKPLIKTSVSTTDALNGNNKQAVIAAAPVTSYGMEPEQLEAVNLSQKSQTNENPIEGQHFVSKPSVNGKKLTCTSHRRKKASPSTMSHSNIDTNYTYLYAIDLSKAKSVPEAVPDPKSVLPVPSGKVPVTISISSVDKSLESTQASSASQVALNEEKTLSAPSTPKKARNNTQIFRMGQRISSQVHISRAHNQVLNSNVRGGAQPVKVSNSLALVVANLANTAMSNLVTSIKLASCSALTESLSGQNPTTAPSSTIASSPSVYVPSGTSNVQSTHKTADIIVTTSSFKPTVTEDNSLKISVDLNSTPVINNSTAEFVCNGSQPVCTNHDSLSSKLAVTSSSNTQSLQTGQLLSVTSSVLPTSNFEETKALTSSSKIDHTQIPKTIITVPLLPSQTNTHPKIIPSDAAVCASQSVSERGKPGHASDLPSINETQCSDHAPHSEPKASFPVSLATTTNTSPSILSSTSTATTCSSSNTSTSLMSNSSSSATVQTSSTNSLDCPKYGSIFSEGNKTSPVSASAALSDNSFCSTKTNTSNTPIITSSDTVKNISPKMNCSSTSTSDLATASNKNSPVKSDVIVTAGCVTKEDVNQKKHSISEEKTFLSSKPRKSIIGKVYDAPGKKLEASVSKLLLPRDPRKIDTFLFDTMPNEKESPTSTCSPTSKGLLLSEQEEASSSSFIEDTISSVARGTLPETSDIISGLNSESPFAAEHHLPKTISQTSKAHASRKSTNTASNYSTAVSSTKVNNDMIQTTKISTLIPKSSSTVSKTALYAKAFSYPSVNTIPASRSFLHSAFPHASLMHPDFTAMVNGTNFVRSLLSQHAARQAMPRFLTKSPTTIYHMPSKVSMPASTSKQHMSQVSSKDSSRSNKTSAPPKSQTINKSQISSASSKLSASSVSAKSAILQTANTASTKSNVDSTFPSTSQPASQKEKEIKSIKLRTMPPLTIPKSSLGGTTLKLQRSPGSTDHYVFAPSPSGTSSSHYSLDHYHNSEKAKLSKETKRSNSVSSGGSRTPTSPVSPKDGVLSHERQRVPTIKISDINRNPIIVDSGTGSNAPSTTSTSGSTTSLSNSKNSTDIKSHSISHQTASLSSSSSRPPSTSSTSSLSPSSIPYNNNNNITLPSPNSSSANYRISSRGCDRGSDSSCSPTGSVPERSPARDCRRPPSAEFLLPHHQRWHGFPTAELLFHGFKVPAHSHFHELHYDTDAMPLDYSQSSSKS